MRILEMKIYEHLLSTQPPHKPHTNPTQPNVHVSVFVECGKSSMASMPPEGDPPDTPPEHAPFWDHPPNGWPRYSLENATFLQACKKGILPMVQRRWEAVSFSHKCIGFGVACECGHLGMAQWMHEHLGDGGYFRIHRLFDACERDNLPVVQWLWSVCDPIDLGEGNRRRLFSAACHSGQLKVAQWIFSVVGPDVFADGEHFPEESSFEVACREGHMALAQWIRSVGGVDARSHMRAFQSSVKYMRWDVARWLVSLNKSGAGHRIPFWENSMYMWHLRCRWRCVLRAVALLARIYTDFLEKSYAPGGRGFSRAKLSFQSLSTT